MAAIESNRKGSMHIRSNSFPSAARPLVVIGVFVIVHLRSNRTINARKMVGNLQADTTKRVACDSEESNTNEFEKVDAALQSLISLKQSSMGKFQTHLKNLEMCIEDLEVGAESLSRQLTRTRVSLLNLFNH